MEIYSLKTLAVSSTKRRIIMNRYDNKPILIFWESTKACKLKCKHCRAEAILKALPGELKTDEAMEFISSIKGFEKPYPVLIITGGDPLMRNDLFEIITYAYKIGIHVGLAPSVTELLNDDTILRLKKLNVNYISISLDGGRAEVHDSIRGVEGHFRETLEKLEKLVSGGFKIQVNTLVAKENVLELPYIVKILYDLGIKIWEVFFLIKVGRGVSIEDLTPDEYEDVVNFLYEVSRYGFEVRTVEAPFFRRVVSWRSGDEEDMLHLNINRVKNKYSLGNLYVELTRKLIELMGRPRKKASARPAYTRDGNGIIFVAYNGDIYPSGFAPYKLGNVKKEDIVKIYRENSILKKIRRAEFKGRCGRCEFREICGGSRSRAYAVYRDILAEDPACRYIPK